MIDVRVEAAGAAEISDFLKIIHQERIPKATADGVNRTALQAQEAVRANLEVAFTLRRRDWARRSIKMAQFANLNRLAAILRVETPGDPARSDILTQHEQDGEKRPRAGGRLAVPDESLTRGGTAVVPSRKRPKAFDFTPWGKSGTHEVFRGFNGSRGVFMVKGPGGTGGILERTGERSGKKKRRRRMVSDVETRRPRDMNLRFLYRFTESATLESRLHFIETAVGVVNARFSQNLTEAMDKAIMGGKTWSGRAGEGVRRTARADVSDTDRAGQWSGRMRVGA